jgi:D-aminopeptidase
MKTPKHRIAFSALLLSLFATCIWAAQTPRSRDLGIIPGYMPPGKHNAITDVTGVRVGHVTLIDASKGMHTGVTAILPHGGNLYQDKVPAGYFQGNGYGKIMGISQIIELGEIETPILLTNTLSVPEVAAGVIEWTLNHPGNQQVVSVNAVVGETNDSRINAIRDRLVTKDHAIQAIQCAKTGPVAEGNVGAGTGTVAFGFKAGIGTSSRVLNKTDGAYTVGVLVQANYGGDLHILGIPVGRMLKQKQEQANTSDGSVMIIVATDAPLSDRNLTRLAKRAILGIGRSGGNMSNGSGDYVLAFSTARSVRRSRRQQHTASQRVELPNHRMTPLFSAVIEATEEAAYNALMAAESAKGRDGKAYEELPVETVLKLLKSHGRLQ